MEIVIIKNKIIKIIIYISNFCNDCKKAIKILNKYTNEYLVIDISNLSFHEKVSLFNESKQSNIPIIKINDIFTNEVKLESILKQYFKNDFES